MERLTNPDHREMGMHSYVGSQNPYEAALTLGEISNCPQSNFSPKKILEEVFAKLAAYEDAEEDGRLVMFRKEDYERGGYELAIDLEDVLKEWQFSDMSVGINGCSTYETNLVQAIIAALNRNGEKEAST